MDLSVRKSGTSRVLVTVLIVMALSFGPGCRDDEKAVHEAMKTLASADEMKVRTAVRALGELTAAKNIMSAVEPLIGVFEDRGVHHDVFTRSLAAQSLARIAASRKNYGPARRCLDPLVRALLRDQSQSIRSGAALALGFCGFSEVERPLEVALLSDESLLVRTVARKSLDLLTQGQYTPPGEASTVNTRMMTLAATADSSSRDSQRSCLTPEEYEWIHDHVIMFSPEQVSLEVCEQ